MTRLVLFFVCLSLPLLACRLPQSQVEPTPTASALPTRQPSATPSPTPAGPSLDRSSPESIAAWMAYQLEQQNYAAVGDLVLGFNAGFWYPGVGFNTPAQNNNSVEFAAEFQNAVKGSPFCEGFNASGPGDTVPKLFIYFSGLQLNQEITGIPHDSEIVSFLFLQSAGSWSLAFVIPEAGYSAGYILNGLEPCR
ncbi:MAG: hypothetical protein KIS80_10210 [Anaerolineales bacterium]|nr:hypothetical protein [Anaerolineales bacterium]